jgi:hypothetical protein
MNTIKITIKCQNNNYMSEINAQEATESKERIITLKYD